MSGGLTSEATSAVDWLCFFFLMQPSTQTEEVLGGRRRIVSPE